MKCVELTADLVPAKRSEVPNSHVQPAQIHFERYTRISGRFRQFKDQQPDDPDRTDGLPRLPTSRFDRDLATLGSEELTHCYENNGFFSAALTAYNKHWKLRTSPDDWWFTVIKRVTHAIEANSEKNAVRKMFVNHEGQKILTVAVANVSIYDIDYSSFFDQITDEIARNIKVPEYVKAVTADFTTTTSATKIVSQMTVMTSLKRYFRYAMRCICGIPGVEMLGTEQDWVKLGEKLKVLKEIVKPIEDEIGLSKEWWSHADMVFQKLLDTYRGQPDREWWDRILHEESAGGYGESQGYTGWLVYLVEGTPRKVEHRNLSSGLVSVPLELTHSSGNKDVGTLAAGMLGFTVHEDKVGSRPSIRPFQGWSLLLPENSPFRVKHTAA